MVVISDGSLNLQYRTVPPATSWTTYDIPFLASSGWEIANDGSGDPGSIASEAQLQQVLSNLVFLNIDVDWNLNDDLVDLDNVRLESATTSIPEPLTILGSMTALVLGKMLQKKSSRVD